VRCFFLKRLLFDDLLGGLPKALDRTGGLHRIKNLNANLIALPCPVDTFGSLPSPSARIERQHRGADRAIARAL